MKRYWSQSEATAVRRQWPWFCPIHSSVHTHTQRKREYDELPPSPSSPLLPITAHTDVTDRCCCCCCCVLGSFGFVWLTLDVDVVQRHHRHCRRRCWGGGWMRLRSGTAAGVCCSRRLDIKDETRHLHTQLASYVRPYALYALYCTIKPTDYIRSSRWLLIFPSKNNNKEKKKGFFFFFFFFFEV